VASQTSVETRPPTSGRRVFDFGFAHCDTQSGGVLVAFAIICGSKLASNFVIHRLCEIKTDRLTGWPNQHPQALETISPEFLTAYAHELDTNRTVSRANWVDIDNYRHTLSAVF
jgi:hypothetical protein